jgi:hypothetical protein
MIIAHLYQMATYLCISLYGSHFVFAILVHIVHVHIYDTANDLIVGRAGISPVQIYIPIHVFITVQLFTFFINAFEIP